LDPQPRSYSHYFDWRAPFRARDGTVTVHQDARLFVANLEAGDRVVHEIGRGRGLWLQLARGIVGVNGTEMREGDGSKREDVRFAGDSPLERDGFELLVPHHAGSVVARPIGGCCDKVPERADQTYHAYRQGSCPIGRHRPDLAPQP
jgi:hypothetical protein